MENSKEEFNAVTALVPPRVLKSKLPATQEVEGFIEKSRQAIRDILHGREGRKLVVVVGPCSIHDPELAYEYAASLKSIAGSLQEELVIVMRVYLEKPRTIVGWKGLIYDPRLDGSCDLAAGLELARTILLKINQSGVPCATELLNPLTATYISDLLSWAVIGARTSESQIHREMASGLPMPIGFKNGTDGRIEVALNAMVAARHPHTFLGINPDGRIATVATPGNPDRHIVLRGGEAKTNYSPADVAYAAVLVASEGVARPIMIDCSHDNSRKDHRRQGIVCREVLKQVRNGQQAIMGLQLESNLFSGRQAWRKDAQLEYGISITDACISWKETEELLYEIADAVRSKCLRPPLSNVAAAK